MVGNMFVNAINSAFLIPNSKFIIYNFIPKIIMGLLNFLFGGNEKTAEQTKKEEEGKKFDLFKYDGVKAMKMGQVDYAIRCFNEALKLQEDAETIDYLAQALMRKGDLQEAYRTMERLAELAPDNVKVLLQMARIAYMMEDYEAMSAVCDKAIEKDAQNAVAYMLQGQAMAGQGNQIGAIAMLTKAISQNEQLGDAYLLRGRMLLGMGDVASADADADHLMALVPENEDVLMLKAAVEHAKGNRAEAINIYNNVIELNPFNADAYKLRGKAKYEEGDTKGAKEDVDKLLELMPDALSDVSGDFTAEGIEHKVKQAYSMMNPLGL